MSMYTRRQFLGTVCGASAAFSYGNTLLAQQSAHAGGEEWADMKDVIADINPPGTDAVLRSARDGIERYRKRDVELRIIDRTGNPISRLPVDVVQLRQAFPFGDQLWRLDRLFRFNQHETDTGFYFKQRFKEVFNAANALCYWTERPRNDGPKTEDVQGRQNLEGFAYCADWAAAQGLTVKGHPLFWSIPKCIPEWVKRYDAATQMKFAETRIRNIVARFRGKVRMWDAVNEPLWEAAPQNLPNRHWPHLEPIPVIADYIEPVLRWGREEDPDAAYLINDYGMSQDPAGGPRTAQDGTKVTAAFQRKRYIALMRELGERGSPPDAMGLQCHVGGWMTARDQVAFYDEMAGADLPIHITEFWASTKTLEEKGQIPPDEIAAIQADYIENYLTCAFGHPAVEAFFFWGFMNTAVRWGEHSSHELTPLYHRVRDLLNNRWMTRTPLLSDRDGVVRFRGFYGDYALRYALLSGMLSSARFAVNKEGTMPLNIVVPLS